jgi:hypothetical protein
MKKLICLLTLYALFSFTVTEDKVYVCNSEYAKKYHYSETCRGLNACKHKIITMTEAKAKSAGLGLCSWD